LSACRAGSVGFLSYARYDIVLASQFLAEFKVRAAARSDLNIDLWYDEMIDTGQDWLTAIRSRLQAANFAVMLLSPAFVVSDFIRTEEIPHFLASGKPVVLPLLVNVDIATLDTGQLDGRQIYRHRPRGQRVQLSYQECDDAQRGEFIDGLLSQMGRRLRGTS
jgi:hypothetical protein